MFKVEKETKTDLDFLSLTPYPNLKNIANEYIE